MAEFRINLKESIRIKKEFTAIIKELKDLEKRLYAVKDNLSSMSEYKEIVNRLDRQCQEVTEERKDVEKLLQTFSDCVKCYENAEKKVKEQEIDWHFVLDAAGLIPGIGAAFDGVNTAWYAAEGDWSNALLSGMAFAPGIGEVVGGGKTAVKAGGKVIGHLDDAADIAKAADKAGDAAKAAGKARKAGNGAGELGKYVDEAVEGGTDVLDEIKRIDEIEVEFNYNSKYDEIEFARQLAAQQKGMNELTVQEYLDNRQKYIEQGRAIESNAAQQAAREKAFVEKVDELQDAGLSLREAEEQAQKWLDTQTALHNPDQVAGGFASNVGGVGDKGVNSSIGSQWRYRIDDVDAQIQKIAENMSEAEKNSTYLNVNLIYKGD